MKTAEKTNVFTQELDVIAASEETKLSIKESFLPFFEQAQEWKEKAEALVVTDVSEVDKMKDARVARLAIKNIRVDVEKKRKELKEESLRKGKAIDGIANVVKYLIQPIESHLQEQEDFAKNLELKQKAELKESRTQELDQYDVDSSFYNLAEMPEESYKQLLENSKAAYKARIEAEQKAEAERIEKERLDVLESKRRQEIAPYSAHISSSVMQELRTMSEEVFLATMQSAKKADEDYKAEQAKIKAENERLKKEAEAKEAAAEKARVEREKKEAEAKAKHEAELKKEREAKAKLEAEIKAKKDAERKAAEEEKARLEADAKAKAKAEKEARLAPDKVKLENLAKTIVSIELPEVKSAEAKEVLSKVQTLLNKTSGFIKEKVIEL